MNEPSQHSFIVEQATLGGLMEDNAQWFGVKDVLTIDDFLHPQHKVIYQSLVKQLQANKPADIVTMSEFKDLDVKYLASLLLNNANAGNTLYYAHRVKEHSERHQLKQRLLKALQDADDITLKPHELWQDLADQQEKTTTYQRSNSFMFEPINNTTIKPLNWIIEDFLEACSLAEVFGAPESGKSLLAIDWGLSVAAGIPWQGHATQQGAVFYIAGEGQNGLARRFGAWGIDNGVDIKSLPFYRSEQAAALYDLHSAISVERAINQIALKDKNPPRLIIIDTLARNFGGGNENSTEDMSLFVAHIDKHLRDRFNCTVLLVHHTGHGSSERGRGSSALKAAVDTEYSMIKNDADIINLTCTKMKDAAHPLPKSFQILAVDLKIRDEKGNPANGPVLIETAYAPPKEKTSVLGKNEKLGLSSLAILFEEMREYLESIGKDQNAAKVSLSEWQERLDLNRKRFFDIKNSLQDKGLIIVENGFVFFPEDYQE